MRQEKKKNYDWMQLNFKNSKCSNAVEYNSYLKKKTQIW